MVTLEIDTPEDLLASLDAIEVPGFAGPTRIVVDPHAGQLLDWLDAP